VISSDLQTFWGIFMDDVLYLEDWKRLMTMTKKGKRKRIQNQKGEWNE
jgi:hypothetical protein